MNNRNFREEQIELLRNRLNLLVAKHGGNLQHPEVIDLSTKLDQIIVCWQKEDTVNRND